MTTLYRTPLDNRFVVHVMGRYYVDVYYAGNTITIDSLTIPINEAMNSTVNWIRNLSVLLNNGTLPTCPTLI